MKRNKKTKKRETIRAIEAQYICTFKPYPKGGYMVRCKAFPEIVTSGKTLAESRDMARDAIELCLEVYRSEGWAIPKSDADPHTTLKEVIPARLAFV